MDDILRDTGPSTWSNPIENDRTRWEERYVDELADGYNPIAQSSGLKGGQSAEGRQKVQNIDKLAREQAAKAKQAHPGQKQAVNPWMKQAPPAPQKYGIVTEEQRIARVRELESKLGVDKAVLVSSPVQIDTTAHAADTTAYASSGDSAHCIFYITPHA